ncbi:MAG: hypothetical protein Q4C10_09530 [Clostridia bacterium]|nr:hypothetical protein [Clostridia bacterium]
MKRINHDSPFVIPICVGDGRVLYDEFDPAEQRLSDAFKGYLEDFIEDRKPGEGVRLELTGSKDFDLERFRRAYRLHIDKLRQRNHRDRARKTASALRLLGIGVVFVLIGIAFSRSMGEVVATIVSTVGSFAIWEASAVWIEELPVITARERVLAMLGEADIVRSKEEEA